MEDVRHSAKPEKVLIKDGEGRRVWAWTMKCVCGVTIQSGSRDTVRSRYKDHAGGLMPRDSKKKILQSRQDVIAQILIEKGPMRSGEVQSELFRRGDEVSEPTARKLLHLMVEAGRIVVQESPSKRSKRVVMYAASSATREEFSAKVREFDRRPSGFAIGQSF